MRPTKSFRCRRQLADAVNLGAASLVTCLVTDQTVMNETQPPDDPTKSDI